MKNKNQSGKSILRIGTALLSATIAFTVWNAAEISAKADPSQPWEVQINEDNFPDEVFRNYVKANFDSDNNGWVDISPWTIDLDNAGVASLEGIEFFTGLGNLSCRNNPDLTTIDLSNNNNLRSIDVTQCGLTSLNTGNMSDLNYLKLYGNNVQSLDLSNNKELVFIECGSNPLGSLDVSNNTNLRELVCPDNQLETLDISMLPDLVYLMCHTNNLTSLNVNSNTKLKYINCCSNQITELDISNNPDLEILYCDRNDISKLDISNQIHLRTAVLEGDVDEATWKYGGIIYYQTTPAEGSIYTDRTLGFDADVELIYPEKPRFETEDGKVVFVKNNEVSQESGFVECNNAQYLVTNGVLESEKNGLIQDPNNKEDWYYCANGKVQAQKSGLAQYGTGWFYVKDGKLDTSYTGLVEYNGGKFMVARGRILKEKNGLAQDPNNKADWYFLANGQVQAKKTGVVIYNKAGFYVVNGKLDTSYTGKAQYNGKTVNIVKGRMK